MNTQGSLLPIALICFIFLFASEFVISDELKKPDANNVQLDKNLKSSSTQSPTDATNKNIENKDLEVSNQATENKDLESTDKTTENKVSEITQNPVRNELGEICGEYLQATMNLLKLKNSEKMMNPDDAKKFKGMMCQITNGSKESRVDVFCAGKLAWEQTSAPGIKRFEKWAQQARNYCQENG